MIRVLHVFGRLARGGAESRTMDIYRSMDRSAIQFDFIVHSTDPGDFDDEVRSLGGRIYRIPRYRIYNHLGYQRIWRRFLAAHPEYAIVHIHATNVAGAVLSVLARADIPGRIAHARSAYNPDSVKRLVARLSRHTINTLSTHRLAVSHKAAEYLYGRKAVEAGRVQVMSNAIRVDDYRFDPAVREAMRQALAIPSKAPVFAHAGRFEAVKNHAFLLHVFSRARAAYPDAHLVLAGDGPLMAQEKERADSMGLSDCVHFLGLRDDVPRLMQAFDVLLLPSLYEGLPGVVLEAQAAGLRCLVSDAVTRECAVVPSQCTFLPIQGESAKATWASACEMALKAPRVDAADLMKRAGFDVSTQSQRYMELYLSIAKTAGAR